MALSREKAPNTIVELFRHNTWANLKTIAACEEFTEEQLNATIPGLFGSVRAILGHIIGSELSYVHRVNGRVRDRLPERGVFPGFDALKADAIWCGDELVQLALNAGPGEVVQQKYQGETIQYPLTSLMTQAITHSVEHRAHISTILTEQGIEPPDTSGWAYMDEMGQMEGLSEDQPKYR